MDNMLSTLGLIVVTSLTFEINDTEGDPLVGDIIKIIVKIMKLNLRTSGNQTLLHLCLTHNTNNDNIFNSETNW